MEKFVKNHPKAFILLNGFLLSGLIAGYCFNNVIRSNIKLHAAGPNSVGKTLWAWGSNTSGQIGDGTNYDRASPVELTSLAGQIQSFVAGAAATALKTDGTVWTWGGNGRGQLGQGTSDTSIHSTPSQIPSFNNVIAIAGSSSGGVMMALKADGTVWAWGSNDNGQLGNNNLSVTQLNSPTEVVDSSGSGYLNHVIAISVGGAVSLALKSDGTVYAWGLNDYGEIGNGTYAVNSIIAKPTLVSSLTNVRGIATTATGSYAIKDDGSVWTWGQDRNADLGIGASDLCSGMYTCLITPHQITALSNISSLSAGGYDSSNVGFATQANGTLYRWDGSQYNGWHLPSTYTSLSSIPSAMSVGGPCGLGATCSYLALNSDGTVSSWGNNQFGQLGNGTLTDISAPTTISGLSHIVDISEGYSDGYALTNQ